MHKLRITASQVVHYSKLLELDDTEFESLKDVWECGSDRDLAEIIEDYIDLKNDVVDWDNLEEIELFDGQTGRLLDV